MMLSKEQKKDLVSISNFRDKNEKAAWLRKKNNLEQAVKDLEPLEQQILELTFKKQLIMDDIERIRKAMASECIHPQDYLVHYNSYVKCRFCENNISIPRKI